MLVACVEGEPGAVLYTQRVTSAAALLASSFAEQHSADALRCAGGAVVRLQVRFAAADGTSATTTDIAGAGGGVSAGDTKRYQLWYRDPNTTPCGGQFNLSNGLELTFGT